MKKIIAADQDQMERNGESVQWDSPESGRDHSMFLWTRLCCVSGGEAYYVTNGVCWLTYTSFHLSVLMSPRKGCNRSFGDLLYSNFGFKLE